jgi:hypothetical protein
MGEFNRGKSSILNALIDRDLLPVDVLPTTAAIHILRFSRDPVLLVHWRDGTVEERTLSGEALQSFASIESAEALMYLEIGIPTPILAGGVVFVDTPGVDDLNKHRAEVTYRFVPRSDAVVFVLDATTAVRRTEAEFLESSILAGGIERLVFVANFADLLDSEDERGLLVAIRNRLAAALGDGERPVFLVSARQALLAKRNRDDIQWNESGFPAFIDFLETLKTEGPRSISKARHYVRRAQAIASRIASDIDHNGQLHEATDVDLRQRLTALIRLGDAVQSRRERIGKWIEDRENEILVMVGKSLHNFGEQLEEEIRDIIVDYSGTQFQQLVQERIPGIVKRRIKSWVECHADAMTRLLAQLHRELVAGLEREFQRDLCIARYDHAPVRISQTTFNISADDVSSSYVQAGVVAGAAAGLLMLVGVPVLIPILAMGGLPYLQGAVLQHKLNGAKAKALPEFATALRQGMAAFSEGVLDALRSEISSIRSVAESVYDEQMVLERQRVEREMAQRHSEQNEARERADVTAIHGTCVKKSLNDLEDIMRSLSEEVVSV